MSSARRCLVVWRSVVHGDGIVSASYNAGVNVAVVIVAVLNGAVIVIGIAAHIPNWFPTCPTGPCCDKLEGYMTYTVESKCSPLKVCIFAP
jgi:hypothetical protein